MFPGDMGGAGNFLSQCIGVTEEILIIQVLWILLPTGLSQQVPVRPHRLLLVEGDQGVQRGVDLLLSGDHEAPVIQELHHEVAAAALGSVATLLGLGGCSPTGQVPSSLLHVFAM